ncbi:Hypothetical protein R9X50_00224600 [Acrodontium crateriforme]|uniref:t-SNARE coiled-coil homology domain-containing protein n=1 Tax=Acrodontium crateriforme TaxID=150365 RepID=A0AAQ3M155_9PEZI|nr:Hypothetical protein R9X50_00224600 [Acrodontium crateriforme]
MSDLTYAFNLCLKERGVPPVVKKDFTLDKIDSFLHEAYSVNARIKDLTNELRSLRPAYLSTAAAPRRQLSSIGNNSNERSTRHLTDSERESIDAESKQLLRQLNNAITDLKQAEDVRNQTADSVALSKRARGGLGGLGRWAAGGAVTAKSLEEEIEEAERNTIKVHRESIIAYLQRKLEEAGRVQSEMMEVRLTREIEKSKSVLSKSRIQGGIPYAQDPSDFDTNASTKRQRLSASFNNDMHAEASSFNGDSARTELTAEQQQVFAQENSALLKHYEDQLDQVRTAERSILEISELQSTLTANIQMQSENIEQLVQDSYSTTENLGKGNKELKRASERRSAAQALFYSTAAFCSFLIVWDLVF